MRASILGLGDLSARDVEGWRALVAQSAEPNPFFEPEYVLPAAELIGGRRLGLLVVREAVTPSWRLWRRYRSGAWRAHRGDPVTAGGRSG